MTTIEQGAEAVLPLTDSELGDLHAWWRAANYLSVGQIYSWRQPPSSRAPPARARQAAAPRALGHDAGTELHLRPPEPRDHGS